MLQRVVFVLGIGIGAMAFVGCVNPMPDSFQAEQTQPEAWALLQASVEAHGGEEAFAQIDDISVSYEGEWLTGLWKFVSVFKDRQEVESVQERHIYRQGEWPVIGQMSDGPLGVKKVFWDGENSHIRYESESENQNATKMAKVASIAAEANRMFLTAPFYFTQLQGDVTVEMDKQDVVDGRRCNQLLLKVQSNFEKPREDLVLIAIDSETNLVRRLRFSEDSVTVDVEVGGHVNVKGVMWPTRCLELIRFPFFLKAYRWQITGLDVNRGLQVSELAADGWSDQAKTPAMPIR